MRGMNKKLFQGQLLNMIAFVPVAIFLYFNINWALEENQIGSGELPNPGESFEEIGIFEQLITHLGSNWLTPFMVLLSVIFILGIIIYFVKSQRKRLILSYSYLILAVIHAILFALRLLLGDDTSIVVFFWVIGLILMLPSILQIIAGTKFIDSL